LTGECPLSRMLIDIEAIECLEDPARAPDRADVRPRLFGCFCAKVRMTQLTHPGQ
jgi:hypothetical protein